MEPASRVVICHNGQPFFALSVQLTTVNGGTHLQWQQVFDAHNKKAAR